MAGAKTEAEPATDTAPASESKAAARLERQVAKQAVTIAAQEEAIVALKAEIRQLRATQERIADALNRRDLLAPPATLEQVKSALTDPAAVLLVLKDFRIGSTVLRANQRLEGTSVDHGKILDGVTTGELRLAIIRKAA